MMDGDDLTGVEHLETRAGLPAPGEGISSSEFPASRRGFIKAGLAAGSIVLSVVNRPAWAQDKDKDKKDKDGKDGITESAAASSTHLSHHPRGT
jgi:hypothetical protein